MTERSMDAGAAPSVLESIIEKRDPRAGVAVARSRAQERVLFFSNCWIFALWQLFTKGGFLMISKSEWGWWFHFMWSPDMNTVQQFEPNHKRRKRLFPPFIYEGYIKETRL